MNNQDSHTNNLADKYFNAAEVMLVVLSADQTVNSINQRGCRILGYKENEIVGKNWFDNFLPERIRKEVKAVFDALIKGKVDLIEHYENSVLTKSGEEKRIVWHNTILKDEKGKVVYTISSGEDVADRKNADELIHQARYDWEDIFNSINDMITIHDEDFNLVRYNKAAGKMLGLSLVEDADKKCYKYYHGTDSPPENCPSCECTKTKAGATFETFEPFLKKFLEFRIIPRFDENKKFTGLIHVVRDITKRKQIEEEILSVSNIPAENPNPVVRISSDKIILYKNDSFKKLLIDTGLSEKDVFKILPDDLFSLIDNALKEGKPHIMIEAKATDRIISYNIIPIMEQGYVNLYGRDVTERNKFEKELRDKVNDLEEFYEMAVGREIKMKELKEEIAALKNRL